MIAEQRIIIGTLLVLAMAIVLLFSAMNFVYLILLWLGAVLITEGMIRILTGGFN